MSTKARRRRRIAIASLCCVPTLLLAAVWGVGAGTSLLGPGRALPERTAAGIAGPDFHIFSASDALEFDDLPPAERPSRTGTTDRPWGRRFTESKRAAGVIGVNRGVEWHGTFATHFTHVAVPMWLPLLCTLPLLAVAGWQVRRVLASARGRRKGRCVACGADVSGAQGRCPECGRALPSVDPVGQLFLAGGSPAGIAAEPPEAK